MTLASGIDTGWMRAQETSDARRARIEVAVEELQRIRRTINDHHSTEFFLKASQSKPTNLRIGIQAPGGEKYHEVAFLEVDDDGYLTERYHNVASQYGSSDAMEMDLPDFLGFIIGWTAKSLLDAGLLK